VNRKAGRRCHQFGVTRTTGRPLLRWFHRAVALLATVLTIGGLSLALCSLPNVVRAGAIPMSTTSAPVSVHNHAALATEPLATASINSGVPPFRSVSQVPATNTLLCPTARVCYAAETSGAFTGSGFERTANGGASWKPTGALPVHAFLTNPSCPTAQVCFGGAIELGSRLGPKGTLEMVETLDGGAHWMLRVLPVPSGISYAEVNELSCPSATFCVVLVSGFLDSGSPVHGLIRNGGTFMITRNGGRSWRSAGALIDLTFVYSTTLRCDVNGRCLSLIETSNGTDPAAVLHVMRSSDFGQHWTISTTVLASTVVSLLASCGDATHCVLVDSEYDHGPRDIVPNNRAQIARTSNGGKTWVMGAAPATWPNQPVAVSCATANDCFVSASTVGINGDSDAVLEVTHNGGVSWHAMALPRFHGVPFDIVNPLSCPVASGCIGLGATRAQLVPGVTSAPVFNQREIVSDLSE
jgi:hypothetical protein